MKKLIAVLLAATLLLLNCAYQGNLSPAEEDKYRRAKQRYDAGQRGGP